MNAATMLTGGKHGTKIIGMAGAVLTAVSALDPALLPPAAMPYIVGAGFLLTLLRGFVNTQNLNAEKESQMPTSTIGR